MEHLCKTRQKEQDMREGPLAGFGLFLGLTNRESRKITRLIEDIRFLRGETIFRKDDPCDSLYLLKEGLVKLLANSEKGAGTILYILRPTDIFGELLLVEERRPFYTLAVTDVLAGVLSREDFFELLSIPRVRLNFIRILSKHLAHVEKRVTEFSHTWSYHRLAKVLLQMCGEYGEETPGGVLLRLSLTHADLADMVGTTRETVTKQLNRFNRLGIVSGHGRHLVANRRHLVDYLRSEDIRLGRQKLLLDKSA